MKAFNSLNFLAVYVSYFYEILYNRTKYFFIDKRDY